MSRAASCNWHGQMIIPIQGFMKQLIVPHAQTVRCKRAGRLHALKISKARPWSLKHAWSPQGNVNLCKRIGQVACFCLWHNIEAMSS